MKFGRFTVAAVAVTAGLGLAGCGGGSGTPRASGGGAAKIGIIHRPNAGPDYLMTFAASGAKYMDDASGQLILPKAEIKKGLEWLCCIHY